MSLFLNPIRLLRQARAAGRSGLTLQRRLFVFLLLFLVAVMSGIFLILLATGAFSTGLRQSQVLLENELTHLSANLSKDAGALAVEGVALSRRLSEQAERLIAASENGDLSDNPALVNEILHASSAPLLAALEKNTCSGVFLVLNATVGPDLPNAAYSRAGLFYKNMEPNAINKIQPTVRVLRGPSSIAKLEQLDLLPQWQMEFSVEEGDFFHQTLAAINSGKELSRLYYWDPACMLSGDYERCVLLCVPLVTSDGTVLGICGFQVSAMLFKLQNSPDNSVYSRIFAAWSPTEEGRFCMTGALLAGSHAVDAAGLSTDFSVLPQSSGLNRYTTANGMVYIGMQQPVNMYPRDALHADEEWSVAVMMPEDDFTAHMQESNRQIYLLLIVLLLASIGAALVMSKQYIAPVVEALDKVKSGASGYGKTRIQEIDDLFAFLAEKDAEAELTESNAETTTQADSATLYGAFIRNIETLSPAERAVFNLYTEGFDAKKITEILCLSMNTIKTHNRRIFQKLGVSSRKELLVYVNMMKEKGGVSFEFEQ